jgi:hypothetical protein
MSKYSIKPISVKQFHEHLKYKKTHSTMSDYKKGQLGPTQPSSKGGNSDHTYSENIYELPPLM